MGASIGIASGNSDNIKSNNLLDSSCIISVAENVASGASTTGETNVPCGDRLIVVPVGVGVGVAGACVDGVDGVAGACAGADTGSLSGVDGVE